MDSSQFDRLARIVGSGQSRRSVLKTLAGGAVSAVVAAARIGDASAATKRSIGNTCASNADCASNLCVQESRTRKICHCATPGDCPQATEQCRVAICQNGACGIDVDLGRPCDDGNACTQGTTCQADGSCAGSAVTCTDGGNPCVAASCDPVSGCRTTPKVRGSSCSDGDACNGLEACDGAGSCVAGIQVVCGACTACNHRTGSCDADPSQNGVLCDDSDPCTTNDVCLNGVCAGTPLDCTAANTETTHCLAGICVIDSCSSGYANCDGNPATGCEAKLDSDPNHCGVCGTVCPDDFNGRGVGICTGGACGLDCDGALVECPSNPGVCMPVTTTSNCGACGNVCPDPVGGHGHAVCSAGQCAVQCDSPYTACNGVCVDVSTNMSNCGGCGQVCAADPQTHGAHICSGGACVLQCDSGTVNCSGSCVDLTTDASDCGACGNVCPIGTSTCCNSVCVSLDSVDHCGGCEITCPGETDGCCAGVCAALDTTAHCGACGNVCDSGEICCSGGCHECCADTDCPGSYSSCAGNVCNDVCVNVTVNVEADYSHSVPGQFYTTSEVRGAAQGTALTFTLLDANDNVVPGGGSTTMSGFVSGWSTNSNTICMQTGAWKISVAGCGEKIFPFVTDPGCPV